MVGRTINPNIMKQNILSHTSRFCALLFACTAVCLASMADAAAQNRQKGQTELVSVSVTVVDEDGNAVPGAEFSIGEGREHFIADSEGKVYFTAEPRDLVTVSSDDHVTVHAQAGALADSKTVRLAKDVFMAGEDDQLPLPYDTKESKRNSLGNTIVIKGEDLEKYSSTDIRNALTAIAAGVDVTENYGGPGVSPIEHIGQYGASTHVAVETRGRQMIYMVDDVPVQINETPLDPQQIESITIVRDALEKNIFGPSAANGIVYIKTKRGQYNDRYLDVNVEGGLSMTDRFPEYADGAQYAQLNNVARNNSGLDLLYTQSDINAYAQGNPYDMWHPSVDYRDMLLKNTAWYTKASVSSGGGNDRIRYYAYLGYAGEDDLYKIGPASDYNRVNINANLDIKLHRYISAKFGIISTMGVRRSANYGFDDLSATEFPDVLSDINTIPPVAFPIYANNDPSLDFPWYAVSSQYTDNPIANMTENGAYTETIRKGLMNVGIDVDFSFLTPGLKSLTYVAYDATNLVRLGTTNDYAAYILSPGLDNEGQEAMIPTQSGSHNVSESSDKSNLLDYFSNRLYLFEKLSYDRSFGKHDVSAYANYMITKRSQKFITEHRREINFGLGGSYSYAGKYIAQFTGNYHGTYSLLNHGWAFSPAVGFGWVMSEEDFMDGAGAIDFLKLRVQAGLLNYDSATSANRDVDNYKWDESGQKFGPHSNNQWFGNSTSEAVDRVYPQMLGNPNLRMERRHELTAGADLVAFDKRFDASLNYYYVLQDGPIAELENLLPLTAGVSSGALWMNYEMRRYHGYEISLGWHDRVGDFSYAINGWAAGQFSKVLRADELNYSDAYRSEVGNSATAIWGLNCIGQFATDEETLEVPQMFDDELKAGDLKYQDMNGDGMIDDNDFSVIGDSDPKLNYGITVSLKYKNLDLFIAGTGRAFYDIALTNEYFWNGWGDGNYSKYTLDNVANPSHPRLSYNKINNNYKTSTYWLADGGYFKLQTVEIGYEFPMKHWNVDVIRGLRVYLRGNNLCTLTGIKYVDPEAINAGVTNYPLMRTFVAGIKLTF